MRKKVTRNRYVLFFLVFFISLGFAYLSASLNILGGALLKSSSWDIHFEDIEVIESVEGNPTPTISADQKSVEYVANFNEPGDVFSFNVDVVNAGTIDGMIDEIINDGLTTEQQKLLDIEYKYANGDPFEEHFVILANARKTINVKLQYKYDINEEDLPTELTSMNVSFSITYKQASEDAYTQATFIPGSDVRDLMISLSDSIANDGLLSYDFSANKKASYLDSNNSYKIEKLSKIRGVAYISAFKRSFELPENVDDSSIVSTDSSEKPIFMWFKLDDEVQDEDLVGDIGSIYWYSDADVVFLNEDSSNMFYDSKCKFQYLASVGGLENINTSKVKNLFSAFVKCIVLNDLSPLSNWDLSNTTNTSYLFSECTNISDLIGLESWNVSSIENMKSMFYHTSINNLSTISNWKTSKLVNASSMFSLCNNLTSLDGLDKWDVSNIEDMDSMFWACANLSDLSALSSWKTDHLKYMNKAFSLCENLDNLSGLELLNVKNVQSMESLFSGCKSLTTLTSLGNWNTKNLNNMCNSFSHCTALTDISELSNWDVGKVKNMSGVFANCVSLSDLSGLEEWNISSAQTLNYMFSNCSIVSLAKLRNWNLKDVTDMSRMFESCDSLINLDGLEKWNVSNVADMSSMFMHCSSLSNINSLSDWNVSNVSNMSYMFNTCSKINSLSALSDWNVSNVTNMFNMFTWCNSLSDASGINSWGSRLNDNLDYSDMFDVFNSTKPSWYI